MTKRLTEKDARGFGNIPKAYKPSFSTRLRMAWYALRYGLTLKSWSVNYTFHGPSTVQLEWEPYRTLERPLPSYRIVQPDAWDPDLDTESSASRQHFIDTGHYLHRGEADEV